MFIYNHIFACLLWYIVKGEKSWMPVVDFIYPVTEIWYKSQFNQYCVVLYYAIMAFGSNEIAPSNVVEVILAI